MSRSYTEFFKQATGFSPYPYQRRLAEEPDLPELLNVPTGAGKTAAVVLAWAWRRLFHPDHRVRESTPHRLVWVLPMRSLVTQTFDAAQRYMLAAGLWSDVPSGRERVSVHVVMGGEIDDRWAEDPAGNSIIVGTQDTLLSRALNRGYGASRFRWPALFGFINNDSLWVFDEIQLMDSGLYTSVQLAEFRRRHGVYGSSPSLWMSATARPSWLQTVDREAPGDDRVMTLTEDDMSGALRRRLCARKVLKATGLTVVKKPKDKHYRSLADRVLASHYAGSQTLVVVNTVDRAVNTYQHMLQRLTRQPSQTAPEILLLHSRFRRYERQKMEERLNEPIDENGPGRIVVSTQVIEAGLDISSRTMFTELAPWSSMVQRFGRVNRAGEYAEAEVYWVDVDSENALPYEALELEESRCILSSFEGKSVSSEVLPLPSRPPEPKHVLRSRDFHELFDTTPDISGYDIDVSRFIRGQGDADVFAYWRTWSEGNPSPEMTLPSRDEICRVPVAQVRERLKLCQGWRWDHLDGSWRPVRDSQVYPGVTILLRAEDGGYSTELGWLTTSRDVVPVLDAVSGPPGESVSSDMYNGGRWITLQEHSEHVLRSLESILDTLKIVEPKVRDILMKAAQLHDWGKASSIFQSTMMQDLSEQEFRLRTRSIWAKRPGGPRKHTRHYFRHELLGALAALDEFGDPLLAYLIASHHGRVRVAIRSLAHESTEPPGGVRQALGVRDGDSVLAIQLGPYRLSSREVSLEPMEMGMSESGNPSWTEQVLTMLESQNLGPFRLAFLEGLLIAADWKASSDERRENL